MTPGALTILSGNVVSLLPRDIPLPQPLPEWLLVFLLIVSFLLHILFVNLMLGGSLLMVWAEIKGLKDPRHDRLAREIAATTTVNKSLAVVLGVAPLLTINTLYTLFFYSANALTGTMWISIVPLLAAAFLLLYLHKFTWERMGASPTKKKIHIMTAGAAALILLFIPLIFLANINLMLFPHRWPEVRGFFSTVLMANVLPRYLHFLCAAIAVTGLFLFGYMKRSAYPFAERLGDVFEDRVSVLGTWYRVALGASLLQFILGPLNLLTLPWFALTWKSASMFLAGAAAAIAAMAIIWKRLKGEPERMGQGFYLAAAILTVTALFMGTGRHFYRAEALKPHIINIKSETAPATPEISPTTPTAAPPQPTDKKNQ